jgi:hypothetical protein
MENKALSDSAKLEQLLKLEFLKTQVGVQINQNLVDFLRKKDIIEALIQYSLAVPSDPDNRDTSYK